MEKIQGVKLSTYQKLFLVSNAYTPRIKSVKPDKGWFAHIIFYGGQLTVVQDKNGKINIVWVWDSLWQRLMFHVDKVIK